MVATGHMFVAPSFFVELGFKVEFIAQPTILSVVSNAAQAGERLDSFVAKKAPAISRSNAAKLIREGNVTVGGQPKKPSYIIRSGELILIEVPAAIPYECTPEPIPLSFLYEDSDIAVINKPAGLVVHPSPGHMSGTLVNALLYHCKDLKGVGGELRPGIVHRIDKDTTGTLVIAKNDLAHAALSYQFKERLVDKCYLALVVGEPKTAEGKITLPIGRHPTDRKRMSVNSYRARSTETTWVAKERFGEATLLEVVIKTGRTHQIRVHCAAIGHPLVGDDTYGGTKKTRRVQGGNSGAPLLAAKRQMLHAWKLTISHPRSGQRISFESPLPEDMNGVLFELRHELKQADA